MWRLLLECVLFSIVAADSLHFRPRGGAASNRICPDKQGTCPDTATCCMLTSGKYGCCPLSQGVCCSDHVHCCPNGYTCNPSSATCTKGTNQNSWFTVTEVTKQAPARVGGKQDQLKKPKRLVCPGGKTYCENGRTCCYQQGGLFGCCPYVNGTCCSDGAHCCPLGFVCDLKLEQCTKTGGLTLPWGETHDSKINGPEPEEQGVTSTDSVICPDQTSQCPDGSTCCLLLSGEYGCCPLPQAVCCSDHLHCCPSGYTCDVQSGQCNKGILSLPWSSKVPARPRLTAREPQQLFSAPSTPKNTACADNVTTCPDGTTCCQMLNKYFACCPFPNAICCSDHLHCCPSNQKCDVGKGRCVDKSDYSQPWAEKFPATVQPPAADVICPDHQSECPSGSTCCKLASGEYGCCPLPQAVCCSDHTHCCPNGYTCDATTATCNKNGLVLSWFEKFDASKPKDQNSVIGPQSTEGDVICPGGQSMCPAGNTCCKGLSGQYQCCPLSQAVCCSDHTHCCPSGYTCDVSAGLCNKNGFLVPWSSKTVSQPIAEYLEINEALSDQDTELMVENRVKCPDRSSYCPAQTTCCKLASGQFGCCPHKNAQCCSDQVHCCPGGYKCDVTHGACRKQADSIPWVEKLPAQTVLDDVGSVVCPDKKSQCQDGSTCCIMPSGVYGCCPIPQAVCCSDHTHCCPSGYTCDVSAGTCNKNGFQEPWSSKTVSQPITEYLEINEAQSYQDTELMVGTIKCPDGTSYCPDQTTCCKLTSGQYGCCPLPKAVCCSDQVHCCPDGYKCDVAQGACRKQANSIPWVEKLPAQTISGDVGYVVCPDKKSQCQDGYTCCMLPTHVYGCCPIPQAVCCSDGLHCCPTGTTCDLAKGTCDSSSNSLSITWSNVRRTLSFVQSLLSDNTDVSVQCADKTMCPGGSTCCLMLSGKYGCCPYAKGTCCSDKVHCCPSGFQCDTTGTRCDKKDSSLSISSTMFTRQRAQPANDDVVCPGGKASCPDGSTCCKTKSGDYGCCPFSQATCCSDGVHCCPQGYACDPQSSTCTQAVPWVTKVPAVARSPAQEPSAESQSVPCGDLKHECPDGSTCCLTDGDNWGCCPLAEAICCVDKKHCCPHGYRCVVEAGMCVRGTSVTSFLTIATNEVSETGSAP